MIDYQLIRKRIWQFRVALRGQVFVSRVSNFMPIILNLMSKLSIKLIYVLKISVYRFWFISLFRFVCTSTTDSLLSSVAPFPTYIDIFLRDKWKFIISFLIFLHDKYFVEWRCLEPSLSAWWKYEIRCLHHVEKQFALFTRQTSFHHIESKFST